MKELTCHEMEREFFFPSKMKLLGTRKVYEIEKKKKKNQQLLNVTNKSIF